MKWFWQRDHTEELFASLPESVRWAEKDWGLRIKKENGKVYVRYVSGHNFDEKVIMKRGKEKVFKKRNYEYFVATGGTKSLYYALAEMRRKLIRLNIIAE